MQIHNYIKSSLIDYPEKIACVLFTQGCPWRCWYCQNAELLPSKQGNISTQEIIDFLKTRVGMLDAVVICGGEPTIQENLADFIKQIKQLGFLVKLDTNGINPDVLESLINQKLVDYVAMDVKAPINAYEEIAKVKVDNEKILKSINILKCANINYEFRTTALPTLNENDFIEIAQILKGAKKYYIQRYVKQKNYSLPNKLHTNEELAEIAKKCNSYVITKLR